jgi:hypothetical protein
MKRSGLAPFKALSHQRLVGMKKTRKIPVGLQVSVIRESKQRPPGKYAGSLTIQSSYLASDVFWRSWVLTPAGDDLSS